MQEPIPPDPPEVPKRFIPLGSVRPPPKKSPFNHVQLPTPGGNPTILSSSIVLHEPASPQIQPLPDIYTTCPELKMFKPLIALPPLMSNETPSMLSNKVLNTDSRADSEKPNGEFDPDTALLRPYVIFCGIMIFF